MFADSLSKVSNHKRVVETTLRIVRNCFLLQGSFGMGQMTSYIIMCTAHYLYFLCDALIVMAYSIDSLVTY